MMKLVRRANILSMVLAIISVLALFLSLLLYPGGEETLKDTLLFRVILVAAIVFGAVYVITYFARLIRCIARGMLKNGGWKQVVSAYLFCAVLMGVFLWLANWFLFQESFMLLDHLVGILCFPLITFVGEIHDFEQREI